MTHEEKKALTSLFFPVSLGYPGVHDFLGETIRSVRSQEGQEEGLTLHVRSINRMFSVSFSSYNHLHHY